MLGHSNIQFQCRSSFRANTEAIHEVYIVLLISLILRDLGEDLYRGLSVSRIERESGNTSVRRKNITYSLDGRNWPDVRRQQFGARVKSYYARTSSSNRCARFRRLSSTRPLDPDDLSVDCTPLAPSGPVPLWCLSAPHGTRLSTLRNKRVGSLMCRV